MQETQKYPFSLIAGQGLGVSFSSLDKIGPLLPMEGYGGANIKFYPNSVTGNLVVQDHLLRIEEQGGPIELGYIYNSLAGNADRVWQLSHPQFISLSQSDQTVVLKESDGHLTTYTRDPQTGFYFAPTGSSKGTPWLHYDGSLQQWLRYLPHKNAMEYYSPEGLLLKKEDQEGRIITYKYDEQQQLQAVIGQSGSRYEIRRSDMRVNIYLTSDNVEDKLLQTYQFDTEGRLSFTQTLDGYRTDYQYSIGQTAWQLLSVKQSDQTYLRFDYNDQHRVSSFNLGQKSVFRLQYPTDSNPQFTLVDAFKGITQLILNSNGDITQVSRSQGYDSVFKEKDITLYGYNPQHQLESITHPDQGKERFSYIGTYGLLQTYIEPNGQTKEKVYQPDGDQVRLIGEIQYENEKNTLLVTRYIYDIHYKSHKVFLRFKISPEGCVTEYRPDDKGNIKSKREYLGSKIDLSQRNPHTSPSLEEMQAWVAKQDTQQITLTEYGYNPRGQLLRTRQYAHVDAQGNGIQDEAMGEICTFPNLYGNWFTKQEKQEEGKVAITQRTFDNLQRLTQETNALTQSTFYKYLDEKGQVAITHPSGLVEIYQKDDRGQTLQQEETVEKQTRTTKYGRDTAGRVVLTTRPDGQGEYQFYDHQDRLGFTVTTSGIVTQYTYDLEHRYTAKTEYATAIDPSKLWLVYPPLPGFLPLASKLLTLIPDITDPAKDRTAYTFTDLNGRPIYTVDAKYYVTQYAYNDRNQKILEIAYQTPLNDETLLQLKGGKEAVLPLNFNQDRGMRYFYDKDGYVIGKQDSGGYVTEYKRNLVGKVIEKILYDTKVPLDLNIKDFNAVKPTPSLEDAHFYYFRDARQQIIAQLTPGKDQTEYYYTQQCYYPNGLRKESIRYATKVNTVSSIPPLASPEDQVTHYRYDALNRPLEIDLPYQTTKLTLYDVMGHIIFQQTKDVESPENTDADHQRTVKAHYDGWGQKDEDTNVYGGQIIHHYDPLTGLKTHTTDALNRTSYYFYDIDKRLIAIVNPVGAIIENVLDSFGDTVQSIHYYNKIAKGQITEGGYLTGAIRKLFISDPVKDEITLFKRDQRGQIIQKTDPNGNVSTYTYNAFKQILEEHLPVENHTPTLTQEHHYDARGLEVFTLRKVEGQQSQVTGHLYNNLYGKETFRLTPIGGIERTVYDVSGEVQEKTWQNNNSGKILLKQTFTHNAFHQIETETDAEGNVTSHTYDQQARSHTVHSPITDVTETFIQNIFKEKIQQSDSLGSTQTWTHVPEGQIYTYTDALAQITKHKFDVMGQQTYTIDANGIETEFKRDDAGFVSQKIEDTAGLKLQTNYERDAFGNATTVTDPRGILTQNTFDQKNQLLESMQDAQEEGLNLITSKTYNAQGNLTTKTQGDKTKPVQYEESFQIDGFNRNTGKTIDPQGLKLQTQLQLDAAGNVIADIDANGHITRKFYDTVGRIRFVIDPEGGIYETNYDVEGRIHYTRVYEQGLSQEDLNKLNDQTSLKVFLTLIKTDPQDTVLYHFYDPDGKERFQVNSRGSVGEKQYDLARREIKTTKYFNKIDPALLPTLTTEKLLSLIQSNPQDRIVYKILDAKGEIRFVIDEEQFISEKRYDAVGNIITRIKYAIKLTDPEKIAKLSPEKVLENIVLDPINDRATYQFFDAFSRPEFTLDGIHQLTQYCHDEEGNLIKTLGYSPLIFSEDASYEAVKQNIQNVLSNEEPDILQHNIFDKGNRKISETDPLGYSDKFKKDAVGNTIIHTDRAGNDWLYHYDGANRLVIETTPPVPVTTVQANTIKNVMTLTSKQETLAIQDKKIFDNVDNELQVIKAENTTESRTLKYTYNKRNQLVQTQIDNVLLDDSSQPASFDKPPVKTETITTHIIYNAKKLKVAEQNENGQWHFYIYNSEGQVVYEVNTQGVASQKQRNIFGEITQETIYANKIKLDLSQYTQTGIPLSVVEQSGVITPSAEDRTKTYQRDRRGDVTLTQLGPTFYYLSNGTNQPKYHRDYSKTEQHYNAFRECFYKAVLLDPILNLYSQQLYWFDQNGKVIAECDPVAKVTQHTFDKYGRESLRLEWANPPQEIPTPETTLFELNKNYFPSSQDRKYMYVDDLAGQCTEKFTFNAVFQEVVFDGEHIPSLQDSVPTILSQSYHYNPLRKRISVTYEDGASAYTYYDARGLEMAVTDVPRQNDIKTLIPLSYFGNDAFGKRVLSTRFKQGTAAASDKVFPVPIALDLEDQTDLKYYDNRGLASFTQNAEAVVKGFTYTATRKLARQWNYLTNHDARHIDEERFNFDALGRPVEMSVLRDNKVFQITASQYNAFGNCVAEGPGDNTWPLYRHYDVLNNCWSHNEKSINTIVLRNLSGQVTTNLQSATKDLSLVTYTQLEEILSWDIADLEREEITRDAGGRKIIETKATYSEPNTNYPLNIPLCIVSGENYSAFGKTSLTWVRPQETTVVPKFTLWPTGNPSNIQALPIQTINGRCGIDVSHLDTDVYSYQIEYYFINPITKEPAKYPQYCTKGEVQIDTGSNTHSLQLVVSVENEHVLHLTGNTQQVSAVELWQDKQKIAQIPVEIQQGKYIVDLSSYNSGVYTVVPVVKGKDNLPASLPFTIYTDKLSKTPLSKEISSTFGLDFLEKNGHHGQLTWEVPKDYQSCSVFLTCKYYDHRDQIQIHQDSIAPGTNKGHYTDTKGNVLVCNTEFEFQVKKVIEIFLSIELNQTDQVIIASFAYPEKSIGDGTEIILSNSFLGTTVLYITPLIGFTKFPALSYLDMTKDRLASWNLLPVIGLTSQGVVVDVTGFQPCIYPFKIQEQVSLDENFFGSQYLSIEKKLQQRFYLGDEGNSFAVTGGGVLYNSDPLPEPPPVKVQPSYHYYYDNWNNICEVIDTLGNSTRYTYNYNNALLHKMQPLVYIVQPDRSIIIDNPSTFWGYNKRGFKIGEIDPNGHTQAYTLDAAGQETAMTVGDGLVVRLQCFDALGRRKNHTDARNCTWHYEYNHLNAVLKMTYPSKVFTSYTYNELNYRIVDIDQSKYPTRYDYDPLAHISLRIEPMGEQTSMTYDRNGLPLHIFHPDGTQMGWTRNYFGIEQFHWDLANVQYTYVRDFKQQKTRQFSNTVRMNYRAYAVPFSWFPTVYMGYIIDPRDIPYQDIYFHYVVGRLMQINDVMMEKITDYQYDTEGREIEVSQYQQGLVRQVQTSIDALDREQWTNDSGATVSTTYDAASNRRHVKIHCYQDQDIWYEFDAANRVTYDSATGLTLHYEAGFRVKESNNGGVYRTLVYDVDGILRDEKYFQLEPGQTITTHRDYMPTGLLSYYSEAENDGVYYFHNIVTNPNGWQTYDFQSLDGKMQSNTTYEAFTGTGFPQQQHTEYAGGITDDMNNGRAFYDDVKLAYVQGIRTDQYGQGPCSIATQYYDPNGTITCAVGIQDETDPNSDNEMAKIFTTTSDGRILVRADYKQKTIHFKWGDDKYTIKFLAFLSNSQYFYNTRGQMIASYGTDPSNPGVDSIVLNYMQHVLNRFRSQFSSKNSWVNSVLNSAFDKWKKQQIKQYEEQVRAPHLNYPDFEVTYPPPAPKKYTVTAGDSCASIAQHFYGDASFASAIAGMNNLTPDQPLLIGEQLNLPQYLPNTNNANNATPYSQFVSIIQGYLYPHLELKQPPKPSSGGFLSGLVHAIVDTVATFVGIVIGFMTGSPELIPLIAGVLTGLADAAYQGVAVAIGWQDHFSLASALTAGLEASISTAIMMPAGATSLSMMFRGIAQETLEEAIRQAGEIAVANQLAEMATGLRQKFDFGQVLSEVGTAIAMHSVRPQENALLSKTNGLLEAAVENETEGMVSGALEAAIDGQQFNISAITAHSLGAAIGEEINGEIKAGIQKASENYQSSASKAYAQAQQDSANNTANSATGVTQNPARTRQGFFNQRNPANNRNTIPTAQRNPSQTNWLTEPADQILKDNGIAIPSGNESSQRNSLGFWQQDLSNTSQKALPNYSQALINSLISTSPSFLIADPALPLFDVAGNVLALYGVEFMRNYVEQHGSISFDFSYGRGLAVDVEIGFSKEGITRFGGIGAGYGAHISMGANYDLQNTSGFTAETSFNFAVGPIKAAGAYMISQTGFASSLSIQPNTDANTGLSIETVAGYTVTDTWDTIENNIRVRMGY